MLLPHSKRLVCYAKSEPNSGVLLPRGRAQSGEIMHPLRAWLV